MLHCDLIEVINDANDEKVATIGNTVAKFHAAPAVGCVVVAARRCPFNTLRF